MVRLLKWFARTLFLATAVFLTSFSPDPMVPASPELKALLAEPASPELASAASSAKPVLAPRKALWGYFYPAWGPDVRPLRIAEGLDLDLLARDPQSRVEPEFRIPNSHRELALFWASIFAEYTSRMKVIHDRNDPTLVYGYLDFTSLYAKRSPFVASITAEHVENEVMTKLETSLKRLSGARRVKRSLDKAEELRLKGYLASRGYAGKRALRELPENLRSQTGQADRFAAALDRSQALLERIEQVFREQGLPRALSRIPFIESSFNSEARSKVGAMGLWQIIPRTARALIHPDDESQWVDPLRQTVAAARLLKDYRRHLPNWEAAVTSYNAGIGRVSRLLRASPKPQPFKSLLKTEEASRNGVGFAGRNYYAELLAANLVEAYRSEIFVPTTLEERRERLESEIASLNRGHCWEPARDEAPRRPTVALTALAKISSGELDLEALLEEAKGLLALN